jgi:CRP/FNR family transcriptional regulator
MPDRARTGTTLIPKPILYGMATGASAKFEELLDRAVKASFLGVLNAHERSALAAGAMRLDIPAGTVIYRDADRARLAVVLDGLLRVFLTSPEGRQVTVRYARAEDLLGVAVTVGGPVDVSVQAVTDSTVAMVDPGRLESLARKNPQVAWAIAEELSRRLYEVLNELAGTAFLPLRDRIVRHLLDLAAEAQSGGSSVAPITQQELADAVGSVREVVGRSLAELRAKRLIETTRDGIKVLDVAALHRELSGVT